MIKKKLTVRQKQLIHTLLYVPNFIRDIVLFGIKGLQWYPDWRLRGLPLIQIWEKNSILRIDRAFTACSTPKWNSLGVSQCVIIKTAGSGTQVVIGNYVGVSGCTISTAVSILIGNHVLLGSGYLITDSDVHPIDPDERRLGGKGKSRPIVIEDDVFIGARAIVLKGVTIGKGSVVGAGAVVTKSVPPYSIVVGNPVKVVEDSRKVKVT